MGSEEVELKGMFTPVVLEDSVQEQGKKEFKHTLFECCSTSNHGTMCLKVCWDPCSYSSKVQAWMQGRRMSRYDWWCSYRLETHAYAVRQSFRKKFGYKWDHHGDCCTALWCAPCMVAQTELEAELYGFSMNDVL